MPHPLRQAPPEDDEFEVVIAKVDKSFFKIADRIEQSVCCAKIRSLAIEGQIQNLKNKIDSLKKPIDRVVDGTLGDDDDYDGPYLEGMHLPLEYGACATPNSDLDNVSRRSTPIEPLIPAKYNIADPIIESTYGYKQNKVTDSERDKYFDNVKMLRALTHARDEMLRQFQLPHMPDKGQWTDIFHEIVQNMESDLSGLKNKESTTEIEKNIIKIKTICEKWGENEERRLSDEFDPEGKELEELYYRFNKDAPRKEYDPEWFSRQEGQTYRTETTKMGRKYEIEISPNAPEANNFSRISIKWPENKWNVPKIKVPPKKPWVERMERDLARPKVKVWKNPSKFDGLPTLVPLDVIAKLDFMKKSSERRIIVSRKKTIGKEEDIRSTSSISSYEVD